MKHQLFATSVLAVFVGALAACSSVPGTSSGVASTAPHVSTAPVAPASATVPPAAATRAGAGASVPAQPSAAATSAPKTSQASPSVPFPGSAGLEKLDSYDMTLRISFKGTRDAQTVNTTDFYTRSFSLDPAAQFTTSQTTGEDGKPTVFMQGFVGDVEYARVGLDAACTAQTTTSADHQIFNPVVLLRPFHQGKDMGPETVNGLPTRHYVMEPLRNADTEMSGDVWISEKNAFVVKYAVLIKGGEQYFGKGTKGEKTLAFELRDVGAKKTVALPKGCLPPVTDLPAMPDAANVNRSLTELSYTTASGMAKTLAFYQEQMQALGWTMEATSVPAQPPTSGPSIPNLPQLPQVPGVNMGQYLPPAVPGGAAPALESGWLVFRLASQQRSVHITIEPDGANWRVLAEIVQA